MSFSSFDEDYVRRLAAGDPGVENHFIDYFGALLLIKLRTRLRSAETMKDVMQETFLRVLQSLREGGLLHPDRLGAFVNSVCNNVLLETFREQEKHGQMPEDPPDPADDNVDLENDLVTRERQQLVGHVLDELDPKDRDLLRMLFLEERDKADICRRMKVDPEYLRVLLHRAKGKFREALEKSI